MKLGQLLLQLLQLLSVLCLWYHLSLQLHLRKWLDLRKCKGILHQLTLSSLLPDLLQTIVNGMGNDG